MQTALGWWRAVVATVRTPLLVTAGALFLYSCAADTTPPPPVASVGVTPATAQVVSGATVQLAATTKDASGNLLTGRTVTWASGNTAMASVNASGMVTGVTPGGPTTITASSEGHSGTAMITVLPVPVAAVTVSLAVSAITVGSTTQATATAKDASGNVLSDRALAWSSSNTSVATVSNSGLVTAVSPGTASISAASEGQTGSATVTVTVVPVASVTVSLASSSIAIGASTQATATDKDASGNVLSGRTVTWSSASTGVATIDASGLVTGVAAGSSIITATSEGKTGSATVTVSPPVPAAFTITSPANRSSSASTTPQFSWQPSSGATIYTLEVATDPSFGTTDVLTRSDISGTSFTPSTPLSVGLVYFWRVTAVNSGGSRVATNASFEFSSPIPVGNSPRMVAITPDGARALVVNGSNPGTVSLVSLSSNQVTGTIGVGNFPTGVAIKPDGTQAVVTNPSSLSVINLATNAVSNTIQVACVGTSLGDITYTPDGLKVVFPDLSNGCTQEGMRIVVISSGAQTFVNLNTGAVTTGIAVMPNGNSALVTLGGTGTSIRRVDLSSLGVTTILNTGSSFGVAVTPDNKTALVASDNIEFIDLATNGASSLAGVGSNQSPHNIAITPDGTRAVVVSDFSVTVVSLATKAVVATFPDGGGNVAITPDGKRALITGQANGLNSSGVLRVIRIP